MPFARLNKYTVPILISYSFIIIQVKNHLVSFRKKQKIKRMKQVKLFLVLLISIISTSLLNAQTADEVITKHVEAIGGKENWKKINSMKMEGTLSVQGTEVAISSTVLHGKGARQDISVMGMTGYTIITPTEGWSFMPFQGQTAAEALTPEKLKESQDQIDAQNSLVDYKEKGHTVELLGKEDVDGTECLKLKLTHKSGKVETMFLDPKTFYIIKSKSKETANGQEFETETSFSNYKKLPEGIVYPMSITVPVGPGMNAEMTISKYEINGKVDEAIFKKS
jgi:hypothetical protein